ncbi:MAG: type II toxin-antitoxin system RelE/ParE family toxin [Vicinamibacterales bacterium]
MNVPVRFEDEADAEYRAAGRWYEARRTGLGLDFFDEVDAAIGQVLELPRAGEFVRSMPAELAVRRVAVKRFPYHVFYLEATEELRILAVAHDRREPDYWTTRLV